MGEHGAKTGRDLPDRNKQEFMKECYRKEDLARLRGYLKNERYRERQKTGEFKMITVLRDRYLGGVPKPGGYYKRVYRHFHATVSCFCTTSPVHYKTSASPPVTLIFYLLTPKIDRFTYLLRGVLVPICIKMGSFVFEISSSQVR